MRHSLAFLVLLAAVSGCEMLNTDGPTEPTPSANAEHYVSLGASDTTGYGSSVPCFFSENCPNGTGYVYVIQRRLQADGKTVTLENVGAPGVVLAPAIQALGNQLNHGVISNVLDGQLRFVNDDTTLVTVFIGGNDTNIVGEAVRAGFGGNSSNSYVDAHIANFGVDYRTLVNGLRSQAPQAKIVVINLPNFAALPYAKGLSLAEKRMLQKISVGFSAQISATASLGARVVDIMCDAQLYQSGNYSSDGFHPNDAGYARLATLAYAALQGNAPAPLASCAQMTQF